MMLPLRQHLIAWVEGCRPDPAALRQALERLQQAHAERMQAAVVP